VAAEAQAKLPVGVQSSRLGDVPQDDAWRLRLEGWTGRTRYYAAVLMRPRLKGLRISVGRRARIVVGPQGRVKRGAGLVLDSDVHLVAQATITFGDDVYVGRGCQIVAFSGVRIGDRCRFGERVSLHDEDHTPDGKGYLVAPVSIGNDVWIGANAVVLRGSVIGDGARVAAGAVVRGRVPANGLVGGVPARLLSLR